MAINSSIKATISHTRTKPVVDSVSIREVFRSRMPSKLWSGVKQTFYLYPTSNGCPVYFESLSSYDLNDNEYLDLLSSYELSSYDYDAGVYKQECDPIKTGVVKIQLEPFLSGGVYETEFDECSQCYKDILIPQEQDFDYDITYNDVTTTLSATVCSNEIPLDIKGSNTDNYIFEELKFIDCKDQFGDSIHFEKSDSRLAQIMGGIFGSEYVSEISSKINNHTDNITNMDTLSPESFNEKAGLFCCEEIDEFRNIPTELSELIKCASIDHSTLFGLNCNSKEDDTDRGDLLSLDDIIYSGETLWYQVFDEPRGEINCLVVPDLYTGVSSFGEIDEYSEIDGLSSYTLGELDSECVSLSSCFWRKDNEGIDSSYLDLDDIHTTPDVNEWCLDDDNYVERLIQKTLIDKISC